MGVNRLTPTQLVLLAVVCLLLFGTKRLPEVGRSLGGGIREFKTTVTGIDCRAGSADASESISQAETS